MSDTDFNKGVMMRPRIHTEPDGTLVAEVSMEWTGYAADGSPITRDFGFNELAIAQMTALLSVAKSKIKQAEREAAEEAAAAVTKAMVKGGSDA